MNTGLARYDCRLVHQNCIRERADRAGNQPATELIGIIDSGLIGALPWVRNHCTATALGQSAPYKVMAGGKTKFVQLVIIGGTITFKSLYYVNLLVKC